MSAPLSDASVLSRRAILRAGAYAAGAAMLTGLPMGRRALAHDVSAKWPNVAALAERYVSQRKVANMLVTFGWGQDDHVETVGGGTLALAKPQTVDEDSLYRIYSMSKPITGMATMILIDEGKLGLDQPLHEILPAFRDMKVLADPAGPLENTVPAIRPITIRQLLTHTAGLGYQFTLKGPLLAAYNAQGLIAGRVSRLPIPGFPPVTPAPGLAAWADRLAQMPLIHQPATKFDYSCSIDLLGRVIEVASGMPFETFLKTRIFEPCGMDSTFMQVPQREAYRLADNYGILGGNSFPIDPAASSIYLDAPVVPLGGADLVSSPRDYDRFLRMLLGYGKINGKRVMSEPAVRVGTSNLIPSTVDLKGSWMEGQGHGAGGRATGTTFGWGGAAGTLAAVDFGLGLRSALFTQYMPSEAYPVRDEFMAAMEADMAGARALKAA